jgi:hypothetical protein
MSWNTNDESFQEKAGVDIFNDGVAGEVEAKAIIETPDKSQNANNPDWKIVFSDPKGSVNMAIWTEEPDPSNENRMKGAKNTIRNLQHIIRKTIGEAFLAQLPPSAPTYKAFVDMHINLLKNNGFEGHKYLIFTTYGTSYSKSNQYIGLRSYPPFIRKVGDGDAMEANGIDVMERVSPDAVSQGSGQTAAVPTDSWT